MVHPKSLFKMSCLSKTSACLWPSSMAMGITHSFYFTRVLIHVPYTMGKFYLFINLVFAITMGYK